MKVVEFALGAEYTETDTPQSDEDTKTLEGTKDASSLGRVAQESTRISSIPLSQDI